jgi:hypothetical protein
LPIIEAARANGAESLREIAGELNAQRIPTPRGGEWSATQVQRVLVMVQSRMQTGNCLSASPECVPAAI